MEEYYSSDISENIQSHIKDIMDKRNEYLEAFAEVYFAGTFKNIDEVKKALPYIELVEKSYDDRLTTTFSFRINYNKKDLNADITFF